VQIRELSKLTGVSSTTIRFYEKVGVLPKARKGTNGYREYPEDRVMQIQMIVRAKVLGFTLNEIKELSALLFSKKLSPKEMAKRLKEKNEEIDVKIESLRMMKSEVNQALAGLCEFKDRLS